MCLLNRGLCVLIMVVTCGYGESANFTDAESNFTTSMPDEFSGDSSNMSSSMAGETTTMMTFPVDDDGNDTTNGSFITSTNSVEITTMTVSTSSSSDNSSSFPDTSDSTSAPSVATSATIFPASSESSTKMTRGSSQSSTTMTRSSSESSTTMTRGSSESTTTMTRGSSESTTTMTRGSSESTTSVHKTTSRLPTETTASGVTDAAETAGPGPDSKENKALPIALGVSIPIAVAAILGIVLGLYCNRKACFAKEDKYEVGNPGVVITEKDDETSNNHDGISAVSNHTYGKSNEAFDVEMDEIVVDGLNINGNTSATVTTENDLSAVEETQPATTVMTNVDDTDEDSDVHDDEGGNDSDEENDTPNNIGNNIGDSETAIATDTATVKEVNEVKDEVIKDDEETTFNPDPQNDDAKENAQDVSETELLSGASLSGGADDTKPNVPEINSNDVTDHEVNEPDDLSNGKHQHDSDDDATHRSSVADSNSEGQITDDES